MLRYARKHWFVIVTLPLLSPAVAHSQQAVPPVDSMLSWFAASVRVHGQPQDMRSGWVVRVAIQTEQVPPSTLNNVLDGLVTLALRDESPEVRIHATTWLGAAGDPLFGEKALKTGVVERLATVYSQTRDRGVRSMVIRKLGSQMNVPAAIQVLERIASEPTDLDPDAEFPLPQRAISALLTLGEEGQNSLRRLHSSNAVKNPRARLALDDLARNSFRPIK